MVTNEKGKIKMRVLTLKNVLTKLINITQQFNPLSYWQSVKCFTISNINTEAVRTPYKIYYYNIILYIHM